MSIPKEDLASADAAPVTPSLKGIPPFTGPGTPGGAPGIPPGGGSPGTGTGAGATPLPRVSAVGKSDRPAARDFLDREIYVSAIAALIMNRQTQAPLTIGIYGPWGSGKSSFLTQLGERLPKDYQVASFNPWRLTSGGEVWAGLVGEIAPIVDRQLGFFQRLRFVFKSDATRSVGKLKTRFFAASKKVGNWLTAATATGGFIAAGLTQNDKLPQSWIDKLKPSWFAPFVAEVQRWMSDNDVAAWNWGALIAAVTIVLLIVVIAYKAYKIYRRPFTTQFQANLAQFAGNSQALKLATFKDFESLRKIIGDLASSRKKHNKPPLVLLIDDLDRCTPDRIVSVLEAVNSFIAELPIITVIAIDTGYVSRAVAARHRFLFDANAGPEAREQYGQFFLEKIIHIPFQLPAARSYERYVEALLAISGDDDAGNAAAPAETVPMPDVSQIVSGLPFFTRFTLILAMTYFLSLYALMTLTYSTEQKWMISIAFNLAFGLELTREQQAWLDKQEYATQISTRLQAAELAKLPFWRRPFASPRLIRDAHQATLSAAIKIQESDRDILRSHLGSLHGNPRSIKRFVNTYLLAKGICTLVLEDKPDFDLPDLAAWLVLLQNWPRYAGEAGERASRGEAAFTWIDDRKQTLAGAPVDLSAFACANRTKLEQLATSKRGVDIARCFSFYTPDA